MGGRSRPVTERARHNHKHPIASLDAVLRLPASNRTPSERQCSYGVIVNPAGAEVMVTLESALWDLTIRLAGVSLLVQTIEFLRLPKSLADNDVTNQQVQSADWVTLIAPIRSLMHILTRPIVHLSHLWLRLFGCVALMLLGTQSPWWLILLLWLGTLVILIRWRGAFNGGSDFMTLAVLSALTIGDMLDRSGLSYGLSLGLLWIALQSASSYFISGAIKCRQPEWRNGTALPVFLDNGVYGPLSTNHPFRHKYVAQLACAGFIVWELSVVMGLFHPIYMLVFCVIGIGFHFGVFWYLGLNRFIFAWLASYPALMYAAIRISHLVSGAFS